MATTVIHTDRERVWRMLLDPEAITSYMFGALVTTDWQVGSTITWDRGSDTDGFDDHGRVLVVREHELLKFSRTNKSDGVELVVTIELQEIAGITHVRVTQHGNTADAGREAAERNWAMMLDGLKNLLGEAPVPPPEEARV